MLGVKRDLPFDRPSGLIFSQAFIRVSKVLRRTCRRFPFSTVLAGNLGGSWLHICHLRGGVLGWSFQSRGEENID